MFIDHPTTEDFEVFLSTTSRSGSTTGSSQIVHHLLADCTDCRRQLEAMGWSSRRLERLLYLPGADPFQPSVSNGAFYNYDIAFAKADEILRDLLTENPPLERPVEALWAELNAQTEEEQGRLIATGRYAHPQMVRLLIDQSHAARYEDPARMLYLAELARQAAEACPVHAAGSERLLADLRTRAWGHFGNSLRVCGRMDEAEEALTTAERWRMLGTGDPPLRARLLEQRASLLTFQRHFEKAIKLTQEAGEIYRELGETHLLASSLVHKAIACIYAGDPERSLRILNHAIPLIDDEEDPHLLLAACHNLVTCYVQLDRPEQALALYGEAKELFQEFQGTLISLRTSWQEGTLLRDLGHVRAAETVLVRARKGFVERSLAYEVAVVSLDLAAVYIKLGEVEKVRQTVAETVPIFRALRVDREALASLLQLQQVANQDQRALEVIRCLSSHLEKLAKRPAAR